MEQTTTLSTTHEPTDCLYDACFCACPDCAVVGSFYCRAEDMYGNVLQTVKNPAMMVEDGHQVDIYVQ